MFLSYEYLVFSIMVSRVLAPNLLLSLRKNHHEDMKCLNSSSGPSLLLSDIEFQ